VCFHAGFGFHPGCSPRW